MRLTTTTFGWIVVCCLAFGMWGQTNDSATLAGRQTNEMANAAVRQMTLEECIRLALDNNSEIKIEAYNPQIFRYQLSGTYGAYDPVFAARVSRINTSREGGLNPVTGETFSTSKSETDVIDMGLTGTLPTGLRYELGGNLSKRSGSTSRVIDQVTPLTNMFGIEIGKITNQITLQNAFQFHEGDAAVVTLSQPLLKNFWIDDTRRAIKIAQRDLKISELVYSLRVMEVVNKVELGYYNLISAREKVVVQEKALALAERLVFEVKKKVEVGTLAPLEEKKVEADRETTKAMLLRERSLASIAENALKNLIAEDFSQWINVRLVPAEKLQALPQVYDMGDSWLKALSQRPDYQQQVLELEKSGITTKFRRNQLYPDVSAFGSYGHSALGQWPGDALDDLRRGINPNFTYGLGISIPLSRIFERNALRTAKAQQAQTGLRVKKLEQDIEVAIVDAINTAKSLFEEVSATRQARFFAEAALDAEQKKFENGKATSFTVLQFQQSLTVARLNEIVALQGYNEALAELAFRQGTTLNRHQINLYYK